MEADEEDESNDESEDVVEGLHSDYDDGSAVDSPTLPVNAPNGGGFHVSTSNETISHWMSNMNCIDPQCTFPESYLIPTRTTPDFIRRKP
jgi:hypothetical protein